MGRGLQREKISREFSLSRACRQQLPARPFVFISIKSVLALFKSLLNFCHEKTFKNLSKLRLRKSFRIIAENKTENRDEKWDKLVTVANKTNLDISSFSSWLFHREVIRRKSLISPESAQLCNWGKFCEKLRATLKEKRRIFWDSKFLDLFTSSRTQEKLWKSFDSKVKNYRENDNKRQNDHRVQQLLLDHLL